MNLIFVEFGLIDEMNESTSPSPEELVMEHERLLAEGEIVEIEDLIYLNNGEYND